MNVSAEEIHLKTKGIYDMVDITDRIEKLLATKKFKSGLVNVFVKHTTCAIAVNEFTDPKLLNDFRKRLAELNPEDGEYEHNESHVCNGDNCVNGHAHCNALLLPTSITCQVVNGKLNLGAWQRIFVIELDRARQRDINLTFVGD
jgi:secondary thiamine-phosphate synthase enzyme